jgi:hypothetical protein
MTKLQPYFGWKYSLFGRGKLAGCEGSYGMAAQILTLAQTAERRAFSPPPKSAVAAEDMARAQFWRGASGRRYMHTVYSLIECSPVPEAIYLLVRRADDGSCQVLHIASGESDAPTLNLARIRQRGATLGANEVHVHFLAETEGRRRLVICDLRAGLFGALSAEPAAAHV